MKSIFSIIILGFFVIVAGCKSDTKDCSNKVTLQLNWIDDPTFTGEYLAKEKFWFADKLNVEIRQGGVGIDPIAMLTTGKADYAVIGADKALIAIANGAPLKIIAVDLQRNPVGWIARSSLKILNFDDIKGRIDVILGDKSGTEVSSILSLILKKRQLNIVPKSVSFDFAYFLYNENVIYPVYLNEEPVKATLLHGIAINEIDPALEVNGGIQLYGNVIVTTKEKTEKCPNQITTFVTGLRKGWEFANSDKNETYEIVSKYVTKVDKGYIAQTVDRTVGFATKMYGRDVPPCHMELTAWESTLAILRQSGLLDKEVDLNNALYLIK